MVFYALSIAGMSTTTTGQESSTCWSLTIHWRRRRRRSRRLLRKQWFALSLDDDNAQRQDIDDDVQ